MFHVCKSVRKNIKTEGLSNSRATTSARGRKKRGRRGKTRGVPEINSQGHGIC